MSPLFDDTAIAFAHKTDGELQAAYRLFSLVRYPWLVGLGTRVLPLLVRAGLPVKGVLRQTIYRQFVGGETLEETAPVVRRLAGAGVQVILDYGAEGREDETSFTAACENFLQVIDFAALQQSIPFISVKVTALARFALLERIDRLMAAGAGDLGGRYDAALGHLVASERAEWERVEERMEKICRSAVQQHIGVLVDAEESWIQGPIDALALRLMQTYNGEKPFIYNTLQLYRQDRLAFLKETDRLAVEKGFRAGYKLVRGAYMEKERLRAQERGLPSPIQPSKTATDRDFNEAVQYCISRLDRLGIMVASHNEESNLQALQLLEKQGLPLNHPRVYFSQLYGMSDHITFPLARRGCNVCKYLPFGPVADVIPYLMRRARENTAVQGQTAREWSLLKKEMKRRGL
ncbi:proline dehydrogenase family protein [Paraflavisolibacter sp. H34]|uniref:proline dehydrogenase family protein n=1 Tax=Huijunlia imazamoxiresistens TaxID=3127457 RepID=UPI0030187E54